MRRALVETRTDLPARGHARRDVVMYSCRHRREALAFAQILSTGSCDTFPCGMRKVAIKISRCSRLTPSSGIAARPLRRTQRCGCPIFDVPGYVLQFKRDASFVAAA